MSYPQPPDQQYSYTAAEQALGDGSLPGQELDTDLAAIRASVTATIEFLKSTMRSDGKLQNGIVTSDSLSAELRIGFNAPAPWVTGTAYTTRDTAFSGFGFYLCVVAHTAGASFSTDLAAGRWTLLADLTPPTGTLLRANDLSDLNSVPTARGNLGLGNMALQAADAVSISGGTITGLSSPLPVASGGTGQTTLAQLRLQDPIINGAFDVWQRGTSSTANGYVAADRWVNFGVGGTVTQARQAVPVGATFGANNPAFFLRQGVTGQSLSTHYALTAHRIEDVRTYAGQTVTILGWAKRNSGTGNMAVELRQSFGTGGSFSPDVTGIGAAQVTLTGSWAPFAVTATVTAMTGKTLGTDGNSFLEVNFWTSAGSTFNARTASLGVQTLEVDLWGVHIRLGTLTAADAASYIAPPVGDTLRACERYYQVVQAFCGSVAAAAGASIVSSVGFSAMRAAPTATVSTITFNTNATAQAFDTISINSARVFANSVGAGQVSWGANYALSAEL